MVEHRPERDTIQTQEIDQGGVVLDLRAIEHGKPVYFTLKGLHLIVEALNRFLVLCLPCWAPKLYDNVALRHRRYETMST